MIGRAECFKIILLLQHIELKAEVIKTFGEYF